MDLSLILARLRAQLVGASGLKSVGQVADLEAAFAGVVATPSAFLLPMAEAGEDMGMLSSTSQRLTNTFGVVHCINNRRDIQGGSNSLDDLTPLRAALKTSLVGWVPDATTGEAVTFANGRLLKMDGDGRLFWVDEFKLITYYWSA